MKALTVYQKLVEKANKNFTNSDIVLDRARAVQLFNEEQNKYVEFLLTAKSTSAVEDIQILLNTSTLKRSGSGSNFTTFKFPENFFSFSNVEITSESSCGNVQLLGFQTKPENVHELFFDENNKPSLKYRETFYTIENGGIKVYKDGFDISSVKLKYYRYPKQLNIEGYIDEFGRESFNSDPEFDDKVVDRIISACVTSFDINNENVNKIQFDMNRVQSKI